MLSKSYLIFTDIDSESTDTGTSGTCTGTDDTDDTCVATDGTDSPSTDTNDTCTILSHFH